MIALKVTAEGMKRALARARAISPENIAQVGVRAAATLTRDHLFELDRTRANSMGGKRTHFFADAARSVNAQSVSVSGGTGTLTINAVGLAQRWLGGTIRAGSGTSTRSGGPTRYLTIPARAEAYGRTAAEYNDLEFQITERGPALVQTLQSVLVRGRRRKGAPRAVEVGGLVMFWLVRKVTQRPDPTVMPTEEAYGESVRKAVDGYLRSKLA